jgi:hypothetical protein
VRPSFDGEWWLLEPSQQLYWFAEADDCSDDTAAPTVDRPQLGRSFETAAYLGRNRKFESIPLQRRVCERLVPQRRSPVRRDGGAPFHLAADRGGDTAHLSADPRPGASTSTKATVATTEPVIGHLKAEHRLGRKYLILTGSSRTTD